MKRTSVSSTTLDLKSILGGGIKNALLVPNANVIEEAPSPSNKSPTN